MKNIFIAISLLLSATVLSSCTQKNGDIGNWFGSWYLEEILINGEPDQDYETAKQNGERTVMFNFQGKIVDIGYLNSSEVFGSWSYAGETLTLILGYNAGSGSEAPWLFNPFPVVMHLPADVDQVEITVTMMNGKTMQWQYIDQNGRLLTYNLRKYP